MRLTLVNRVGFRWMVERLTSLAAYITVIADENEQLNRYLDSSNARGEFESYCADHSADAHSGIASDTTGSHHGG
jgi:hypothetical protein